MGGPQTLPPKIPNTTWFVKEHKMDIFGLTLDIVQVVCDVIILIAVIKIIRKGKAEK